MPASTQRKHSLAAASGWLTRFAELLRLFAGVMETLGHSAICVLRLAISLACAGLRKTLLSAPSHEPPESVGGEPHQFQLRIGIGGEPSQRIGN